MDGDDEQRRTLQREHDWQRDRAEAAIANLRGLQEERDALWRQHHALSGERTVLSTRLSEAERALALCRASRDGWEMLATQAERRLAERTAGSDGVTPREASLQQRLTRVQTALEQAITSGTRQRDARITAEAERDRLATYEQTHLGHLEDLRTENTRLREGLTSLLTRVRPGSEAAPWVVAALLTLLDNGGYTQSRD